MSGKGNRFLWTICLIVLGVTAVILIFSGSVTLPRGVAEVSEGLGLTALLLLVYLTTEQNRAWDARRKRKREKRWRKTRR